MNAASQSAPGKGYDNPKHWGDAACLGDIFQVQYSDVGLDSNYIVGDFYIYQKDSGVDGTKGYSTFPYFIENGLDWKHAWCRCGDSQLKTPAMGNTTAVYANGRHCAAVAFFFTPEDEHGKPITNLPADYFDRMMKQFSGNVQLLDYSTGQPLAGGWTVSATPTAYTAVVPGQEQGGRPPAGASCLTLYVSSTVETDVTLGIKVVCSGGTVLQFDRDDLPIDTLTVNTISAINYMYEDCSVGEKISADTHCKNQYLQPLTAGFTFVKSEKVAGGLSKDLFGTNEYTPTNETAQWAGNPNNGEIEVCTQYYWEMSLDSQTMTQLGCSQMYSTAINDVPGALTVTTVNEHAEDTGVSGVVPSGTPSCKFNVYDQFGNIGTFGVDPSADHKGATFSDA